MTIEHRSESFDSAKTLNSTDLHSSITVADTKGVFVGLNDSAQKAAITLEKQGVLPGLTISGIDSIKNPESGQAVGDTARKIENYSKDLTAAIRNGGVEDNSGDGRSRDGSSKEVHSKADSLHGDDSKDDTKLTAKNLRKSFV